MQPHPGGWCTGEKRPPSLSPPNTITVSLLETHPDIRNPICLPSSLPSLSSLSLAFNTQPAFSPGGRAHRPRDADSHLQQHTDSGAGNSRRQPRLRQLKKANSSAFAWTLKKRIHLFSILLLPFFLKPKRANQAVFNAQPCSSSHLAVRCCPSTTHRSSSSSPAVATCRFLLNEHV